MKHLIIILIVSVMLSATAVAEVEVKPINQSDTTAKLSADKSLQVVQPVRGLIYDRNNIPLVENLTKIDVQITPQQINCVAPETRSGCVTKLLQRLRKIIKIELSDREILTRLSAGNSAPDNFAVTIRRDLSVQEQELLTQNLQNLSSVSIIRRTVRNYIYSNSLAHIIGYMGFRSDKQYAGIAGIEEQYNSLLEGTSGLQQVQYDNYGRVTKVKIIKPAIPGKNIILAIDVRLQALAEKLLTKNAGSVVMMDPKNGEVLALVSKPGFNANQKQSMDLAKRNSLRIPLARALLGSYPPGSTIKPFYALGGLHYDLIKPKETVTCIGFFSLSGSNHRFRDWEPHGHGKVNLKTSIMRSCDVYYYGLSVKMHIDKISELLARFGFGSKTEIDLPREGEALLPSREWKRKRYSQADKKSGDSTTWYMGDTISVGIGQGYLSVTPLQLSYATTVLANQGRAYKPRLLFATRDTSTSPLQIAKPVLKTDITDIKTEHWQAIVEGMVGVVHQKAGTASSIAKLTQGKFKIAGKTGTAQLFKVEQNEEYDEEEVPHHLRDHALFTAFAPAENPQIVVTVLADHAGHGSTGAAPIAARLIHAYLDMVNGNPKALSDALKLPVPTVKTKPVKLADPIEKSKPSKLVEPVEKPKPSKLLGSEVKSEPVKLFGPK